jgi:predicted transcriptional regulator
MDLRDPRKWRKPEKLMGAIPDEALRADILALLSEKTRSTEEIVHLLRFSDGRQAISRALRAMHSEGYIHRADSTSPWKLGHGE